MHFLNHFLRTVWLDDQSSVFCTIYRSTWHGIVFQNFSQMWKQRLKEECMVEQVFFKVLMGYRPPVPPDMPQAYKDLMTACWDEDPANRPPFCDIEHFLRSMYYNSGKGKPRDSRRSLELNPWG